MATFRNDNELACQRPNIFKSGQLCAPLLNRGDAITLASEDTNAIVQNCSMALALYELSEPLCIQTVEEWKEDHKAAVDAENVPNYARVLFLKMAKLGVVGAVTFSYHLDLPDEIYSQIWDMLLGGIISDEESENNGYCALTLAPTPPNRDICDYLYWTQANVFYFYVFKKKNFAF